MGLLECIDVNYEYHEDPAYGAIQSSSSPDTAHPLNIGNYCVEFLHRSLRDFLLLPKNQALLHGFSDGQYDARSSFRSARLTQLVALHEADLDVSAQVGLSSYIVATLGISSYQDTDDAAAIATIMKPVVEKIALLEEGATEPGWYICSVLQPWQEEQSNFLTLAIDFGLGSYVRRHLTAQAVQDKAGRPILDYVLRPRFIALQEVMMSVGNKLPNSALIEFVLVQGANPNEIYGEASVWAFFLCSIADFFDGYKPVGDAPVNPRPCYVRALKIMIDHGADSILPRRWLSARPNLDKCFDLDDPPVYTMPQRFPGVK